MKTFSIYKQGSNQNPHPKEDYFLISKKYPIFVVADGVSLNFELGQEYSKKSGAGEASKIFCDVVITEAYKRYENFEEKDLEEIFELGNKAVLEYNVSQKRIGPESGHPTINYFDIDLFSATTAFLLIKEGKAYWWTLCDAGLRAFGANGQKFLSPGGWVNFPKIWDEGKDEKEKIIIRHRDYRNVVKNGKLAGYGVVTGEKNAVKYLNKGVIKDCDTFLLYTDGFENYFAFEEFMNIFKAWPQDMKKQIENFVAEKSKVDPGKYGREKTLIAVSI